MINANLVLIHGFWSSPATWNKLSDRLSADSELQGLRVHRFGYESPKLPVPFWWTRVPDYNDIAQSLPSYLAAHTRGATVIITHSQGGLILQRFLVWMLSEGRGRELATVKSIVMLACPNDGSEYLRSVRAMAGFGRHAQGRNLKALNSDVADTRRVVLRQVVHASTTNERECPIPIYVYAGRTDRIVRRTSAQGSFPNAGALPGNHFSILDPDLPGSLTVATLKRHLIEAFAASGAASVDAITASPESTAHQPWVQTNTAIAHGTVFAVQGGDLVVHKAEPDENRPTGPGSESL
jgi:pimeloyl-ACP methyl ester carboxylesterase